MNKKIWTAYLCCIMSLAIQAQHFVEAQEEVGIDHFSNHLGLFMGGGAAWIDYDNDGDDDLYLTSGDAMDHFYENNGDGTFTNKAFEVGLIVTDFVFTTGVIVGDIDNDGFKDLFVTTDFSALENPAKNLLFHNNGNGTFSEIWTEEGFADKSYSMGATFLDFNQDGLLDIYVINYIRDGDFIFDANNVIIGFAHTCYRNTLYLNQGNNEFLEVAVTHGLNDTGCSLAVTTTDFDADGDSDIYLANDFGEFIQPNRFFQNDNGNFTDVASVLGTDIPMYAMGITVGDIDMDRDFDLYVTNFGKNVLLENNQTTFSEIGSEAGVADEWVFQDSIQAIGWGTAFLDIDNDLDLDLYVANGYVPGPPSILSSGVGQPDRLFVNDGTGKFTESSETYGTINTQEARGVSYSDFDNDGDLDIVSVVLNIPVNISNPQTKLFKNNLGNEKNWLQVTLEGTEINRDAIGSRLSLHIGNTVLEREVNGGSSHCSFNSSKVHFGLDTITMVDSLVVTWTGGEKTETVYDIAANQLIHIVEDTTVIVPPVGTNDLNHLASQIRIFPNPTQNNFMVDCKQLVHHKVNQIAIWNSLGQVQKTISTNPQLNQFFINIEDLTSGIYHVVIHTEDAFFAKKLIVK